MKKNLLTILILALCVVNVAMNGLLLFSVMGTNNRTAAIIADIAAAVELESAGGTGGGTNPARRDVPMSESETYNMTNGTAITAPLLLSPTSEGGDGKQHYVQMEVVMYLDTQDDGYKEYGAASLADMDARIRTIINDVVGQYTYENVMASKAQIQEEILQQIWAMYGGSAFVYRLDLPTFNPA